MNAGSWGDKWVQLAEEVRNCFELLNKTFEVMILIHFMSNFSSEYHNIPFLRSTCTTNMHILGAIISDILRTQKYNEGRPKR